ncbi:uncharacterized protein [Watersipora subatra]|uniref:uncharacterized protein n=1 Tax=Watersipora subatra TaxID=2589382 RepID=UPI00355AD4BC
MFKKALASVTHSLPLRFYIVPASTHLTLDDTRQRIATLQIESDQKLTALHIESDQKVSALQRQTQQQAEALVEARQQVTTLREDSERMSSLLREEARQRRADLAATQQRLERFAVYLQTPGDTHLSGNQCHNPDS